MKNVKGMEHAQHINTRTHVFPDKCQNGRFCVQTRLISKNVVMMMQASEKAYKY